MKIIKFLYFSIKENGFCWILCRLFWEVELKSGLFQIWFKKRAWREQEWRFWLKPGIGDCEEKIFAYWLENRKAFFIPEKDIATYQKLIKTNLGPNEYDVLIAKTEAICQGYFDYYFYKTYEIGFPTNWHLNPETGTEAPPNQHWSKIPMHSNSYGELKNVWEASRFASAYTLARAYKASGNEIYAEAFWLMIESWYESNPPNHGAHWRCGQEISIRIMAWCFALYAFADSPCTTANRFSLLLSMIAVQANRISKTTRYAHLQQNNHIISEGVGLWTVGVLFPELKNSGKYQSLGKKILEREALLLINEDGSFNQKSNNYHRLMLQDYLYAIRLAQVNHLIFSQKMLNRVEKAVDFLIQMLDRTSGSVPNIGGNDGALVIPINNCDYSDFRPICNAGHFLFHETRIFEPGPWDEDLVWFFGPRDLSRICVAPQKSRFEAKQGGYYIVRNQNSWALIRCGSHVTRPAHADALHFDFWLDGQNVAQDPGSYSYLEAPWNHALSSTSVHNTVEIDHLDQMVRGPRFMWTRWHRTKVNYFSLNHDKDIYYFEGEHDGYTRLSHPVLHRRGVLSLRDDYWILVDDLLGKGRHHCRLHWLFKDVPFRVDDRPVLHLATKPRSCEFVFFGSDANSQKPSLNIFRGSEKTAPQGWYSPTYRVRKPCLSLDYSIDALLPCRFITIISIVNHSAPAIETDSRNIRLGNQYLIHLNEPEIGILSVNSVNSEHGSPVIF